MTDEELYTENEKLVFHVLHKMGLAYDEDYVQIGRIGLWKAVKMFDQSKGYKFSTFACTCIKFEVLNTIRVQRNHNNGGIIVDKEISNFGKQIDVESIIHIKNFIQYLNKREQYVIMKLMMGWSQEQIGKELHHDQTYVSKMLRKIKAKYYMFNRDWIGED